MSTQVDLKKLWEEVNDTLRKGAVNRPLWQAAITAVPLNLDEESDVLVLGMPSKHMNLAGHLETRVNKARVQEVIQAKLGRRLDVSVIERHGRCLREVRRTGAAPDRSGRAGARPSPGCGDRGSQLGRAQ
jgi:hypothetical protein